MVSLKCKEILCLIYSFLLFISGLFLIGLSFVLAFKTFYHFKFVPNNTTGPFMVYFVLGIIHLFLTWLAVKGPTREHDFHIIAFLVITVLLLVFELFVAIWSFVMWFNVPDESLQIMNSSFTEMYINNNLDEQRTWNRLQRKFKCCGVNGIKDYEDFLNFTTSCCDQEQQEEHNQTCLSYFEQGCSEAVINYVKRILTDATSTGFGLVVFQVLGIVLFINFFKTLKQERLNRSALRAARRNTLLQEQNH